VVQINFYATPFYPKKMTFCSNTILITGGATGIGAAFSKRFLRDGNTVIIVGRRLDRLQQFQQEVQSDQCHIIQGDVATESSRIQLYERISSDFPSLNMIVHNAGIQRRVNISEGVKPSWAEIQSELDINLSAPIHLTLLFQSMLLKQKNPAIALVTSGLSFFPKASVPVYSCSKAALHSFTWSLRYQLKDTPIKVIEIIPPAVNTDLQAPGLHDFGMPVDTFADSVYDRMLKGEEEIGYGMSEQARLAYRTSNSDTFEAVNKIQWKF
jgi:uncharacterized oxidoreductase